MNEFLFPPIAELKPETIIRILLYEIRERNPDAIRFQIDPKSVKALTACMGVSDYDTLMALFGYKLLLEIRQLFEDAENYEECAKIMKAIEYRNTHFGIDREPVGHFNKP